MKECIYCESPLKAVKDLPNYYVCTQCFNRHLVAVLYSYDSWGDRFTSIYLDYYHSDQRHVRVGIQPFLEKTHIVIMKRDDTGQFFADKDKLLVHIEGSILHVMLHPHFHLKEHVEFTIPLTTILTPQNVREKIATYLLFS